jgi:hypothetical protein
MGVQVVSGPRGGTGQLKLDFAQAQTVDFIDVSSVSAEIDSEVVRLCASEDCYYTVGEVPVATLQSAPLPAGVVEYVGLTRGHLIAVLRQALDGVLSIIPAQMRRPAP